MRPGEYGMCLQTRPNVDSVNDYVNECDGMKVGSRSENAVGSCDARKTRPSRRQPADEPDLCCGHGVWGYNVPRETRSPPRHVVPMRILAIANQKGGVGKTTTAMNVSACLALAGRRCLLVDVDQQGNATSGLGHQRPRTGGAYDFLFRPARALDAIRETDVPGLHLVPASRQLGAAEAELSHAPDAPVRLRKTIRHLPERYDYVLVDCPPSLGLVPTNALAAADAVIIPIQCEYYAMEGLAQMLNVLRQVRERYNPPLAIDGILFTMYERGMAYADEVAAEVRYHCGQHVYESLIPRDTPLSEAPSHGKTIIDYAPRSLGAWSYVELTKEILSHEG